MILSTRATRPAASLNLRYDPVTGDLHEANRILAAELASDVPYIARLVERVRGYHGKQLRPALLLLVADACGGVRPAHRTLAAVVEMIHIATLVHDDVLDEADVRRHVRTVNADFGVRSSVLMGDYLFTHAFALAATVDAAACRSIGRATNAVCTGEMTQVSRRGDWNLGEDDYFAIVGGKTGELIAVAAELGAAYAGADPETVVRMTAFARDLGTAFQIADDVLDLAGDPEKLGKNVGSDLAQRKITLPLIRLRDQSPPAVVAEAERLFTSGSPASRDRLLQLLRAGGHLDAVRDEALALAEASAARLQTLPPGPARDVLERLTRFAVARVT